MPFRVRVPLLLTLLAAPAAGQVMGTIQDGQTVSDNLPGSAQPFWGKFTVFYTYRCVTRHPIRISVESAWDNVLYVVGPDGNTQFGYNDDAVGRNAGLSWTCPNDETYRIGVGSFTPSPSGAFTLTLLSAEAAAEPVAPVAPAGGPVVGRVIRTGSNGLGNYGGRWELPAGSGLEGVMLVGAAQWANHPIVWYGYQCQQGRAITASAFSAFDNVLYIVTQGGEQVAGNDDFDGTNAQIRWTCPDNQEYLIGIGAFAASSSGDYRLTIM
jgi:hypothetical protein